MTTPVDRTTATSYEWGEGCFGWHLVRAAGLSVISERAPSGTSETRHSHVESHQFFYVLRGEATLELDGVTHRLSPDEGIEVPPGTVHQFRNESADEVEFLVVSAPPSHGDRTDEG